MMRTSARQGRSRRGRGGPGPAEMSSKSFMVTEGGIVQTKEEQAAARDQGGKKEMKEKEAVTETGAASSGEPEKRILRVFDAAIRLVLKKLECFVRFPEISFYFLN